MCASLTPARGLFEPRDNLLAASSADVSSYAGAKGDDFITDPGNHSPRPAHSSFLPRAFSFSSASCLVSLLAFLTGHEARPRNVLANALRAGPAFLDFSLPKLG